MKVFVVIHWDEQFIHQNLFKTRKQAVQFIQESIKDLMNNHVPDEWCEYKSNMTMNKHTGEMFWDIKNIKRKYSYSWTFKTCELNFDSSHIGSLPEIIDCAEYLIFIHLLFHLLYFHFFRPLLYFYILPHHHHHHLFQIRRSVHNHDHNIE